MKGRSLQKLGFRKVLKRRMAGHREVGTIDLQHEAGRNDGRVPLPASHPRWPRYIPRSPIVLVGQKARDHARRCRRHKRLGRPRDPDGGTHIGEIACQSVTALNGDWANAGDTLEASHAGELRHLLTQIGERREVGVRLRRLRVAFLRKAAEAIVHVGGITNLADFAVADDVDPISTCRFTMSRTACPMVRSNSPTS